MDRQRASVISNRRERILNVFCVFIALWISAISPAGQIPTGEEPVSCQPIYASVSSEWMRDYVSDYDQYQGMEIGNKVIFHRRHTIGQAIVQRDQKVFHLDKNTNELVDFNIRWREDLPDALPTVISEQQVRSQVEGKVRYTGLFYLAEDSTVTPITPTPTNPCWIVEHDMEGILTVSVIDAVTGKFLGYGVPPPIEGFSMTGPQKYGESCSGAWSAWNMSAYNWFQKMGYQTENAIYPEYRLIQSLIQSNETALFYELAHGGYWIFVPNCSDYIIDNDIYSWISGYSPMPFTFLGSCEGMCYTENMSFSDAFRKGLYEGTTTVGYCGMSDNPCSDDCWYGGFTIWWQEKLFEYMSKGMTVKEAFDQANAFYPACSIPGCMRFAGDENFAVMPWIYREERPSVSIVYVDAQANGAQDGSSWADAFHYLQDGLSVAGHDDEIWIAQGIYTPDHGTGYTPGDRSALFEIKDRFHLYGGFPSGGGNWEQRAPKAYQTILSGDLNGDDQLGPGYDTDNSITVIKLVSSMELDGLTISGGRSIEKGGGLYGNNYVGVLRQCVFKNNSAVAGGGVADFNGIIDQCVFEANHSEQEGGGIFNCNGIITNCLVIQNASLQYGSAIADNDAVIVNCTFTENVSQIDGVLSECRGEVTNCIIWGNTPDSLYLHNAVTTGCCSSESLNGLGNKAVFDPLFVDPAAGDYHLQLNSPCVDAGTHAEGVHVPATDFDGNIRPQDGNYDGISEVDAGAYELTVSTLTEPAIITSPKAFTFRYYQGRPIPQAQVMSIRNPGGSVLNWQIATDCSWLDIRPGKGITTTETDVISFRVDPSSLVPGVYQGTVTIVDANALNSPVSVPVAFEVVAAIHVRGQYDTIQEAIDSIEAERAIIIVAPGVYVENIHFKGKCIILSSTDPDSLSVVNQTIIQGTGDGSVVTFSGTEDAQCQLVGLTITGGRLTGTAMGGGIQGNETMATISRCVIRDNHTQWAGGGIRACHGLISQCIIRDNSAVSTDSTKGWGGGVNRCYGTITNCRFINNTSYYGSAIRDANGTIVNCTFSKNISLGEGALSGCRGKLVNCIIWGNIPDAMYEHSAVTEYCCWPDGVSGTGNIAVNPEFEDTPHDNFHLLPSSPCIDAGDLNSAFGFEPEPDGGRINMGAYGNTPEATCKDGLALETYHLISKTRVGRTTFQYVYGMTLKNNSDLAVSHVAMTLLNASGNVTVIDPQVTFADIAAGASVISDDSFVIEVDRSDPIDTTVISWHAEYEIEMLGMTQESFAANLKIEPSDIPGDVTGDERVNLKDYVKLAHYWLLEASSSNLAGDDVIDIDDIAALASFWLD